MLTRWLTLGIPALVILAIFVGMGWLIKRSWIDRKPISPGSAMLGRQIMMDLSNDQQRQALVETVEQSERGVEDDDEGAGGTATSLSH